MKIMHLISGSDMGGSADQVLTLLRELSKQHDITLVCFEDGAISRDARQREIRTRVIKGSPFSLRKKLLTGLTQNGYDLLHCHGAKAAGYGCWLRKALDIPVIATVYADPWKGGLLERYAVRHLDGLVTTSDGMKDLLLSRGLDANRIWPVYGGIEFPRKLQWTPRRAYLDSLGLDWGEDCVIFGTLSPETGTSNLIRAFAETVKQVPNARLLVAGGEEQAVQLCPAGTVHFVDSQPDGNSFYNCLDVNVVCHGSKTFPVAILEGARMYCPAISTVAEVVEEGETGFYVSVEDWQKMGECMICLTQNAELRHRMGRTLRQRAEEEFSAGAMARRQTEIYEQVFNSDR